MPATTTKPQVIMDPKSLGFDPRSSGLEALRARLEDMPMNISRLTGRDGRRLGTDSDEFSSRLSSAVYDEILTHISRTNTLYFGFRFRSMEDMQNNLLASIGQHPIVVAHPEVQDSYTERMQLTVFISTVYATQEPVSSVESSPYLVILELEASKVNYRRNIYMKHGAFGDGPEQPLGAVPYGEVMATEIPGESIRRAMVLDISTLENREKYERLLRAYDFVERPKNVELRNEL